MLRRSVTPWTYRSYSRPLLRPCRLFPRTLSTAAATATIDPVPLRDVEKRHDDAALRQVFDSQDYWLDFSGGARHAAAGHRSGLFGNRYLQGPEGFRASARATLQRCQRLVAKIHAASTVEAYRRLAQDFDRLSDLLCRVIDAADFARATHPDRRTQAAATEAHAMMLEFMNTLNTDTRLNDQLKRALADPAVTRAWSEEELRVAEILRRDFAQSAINLPAAKRRRFVELSNDINAVGSQFLDEMAPEVRELAFPSSRLLGIDPTVVRKLTDAWGTARVPTVGSTALHVLKSAADEDIRRQVYIANRTASARQVQRLEQLLRARAELARTAGFESFAAMTLTDKMARTPQAVTTFLEALLADIAPAMRTELAAMKALKNTASRTGDKASIHAWDRDFYRARLGDGATDGPRLLEATAPYFSLGTVMQGLSRLFDRLYGFRLIPRVTRPGETWAPDVRRLDAVDERGQTVAVIYCDLFARPGKSPNPAHFTIRCARRIGPAELAEYRADAAAAGGADGLDADADADPAALANDGMATSAPEPDGAVRQLPAIALVCDFARPAGGGPGRPPPLLPFGAVTTLFHEMGHAAHTILGRTALQTVAGTRCATDFSELPSILMERFARDPAALALGARHWQTDAPLPAELAARLRARAARADGAAADAEWQVLLALLDQALHTPAAGDGGSDSDAVAHAVWARHGSVPEPRATRWQGFFGHLVGYGASYYAYLFDRAIAGRVWRVVFGGGGADGRALHREAGERFASEVLRWGGARDPWACVAGVLGDERLAGGGERAMAEVGRWGLDGKR